MGVPMISQTLITLAQVVLGFLAIPFIVFLPGYFLWKLLFPNWLNKPWEKILLSVALSLAITMTTGFIYYLGSIPIHPRLWFLTQVVLTIIFMISAKRKTLTEKEPDQTKKRDVPTFLIYLYSFLIIVFAFTISITGSLSNPTTRFTQLWVSPVEQQKPISIGVSNNEAASKSYLLELWQGNKVIHTWPEFNLDPGKKWETTLDSGIFQSGTDENEFELRLYDQENPAEVYRSVHIRNGTE
jgi:uncharacterized membrane protein